MNHTKSDYPYLTKNFDPTLSNIAKAMDQSNLNWFVVAGWALDLFVGRKTREHKDIEISIWRDEAPALFEAFPKNQIDMVTGHKRYETLTKDSVIDKRGHLVIRDISVENHNFDIELFTTERKDGQWIFRKQADIQVPLEEAVLTSVCGTPHLAPQLAMLYKAWFYPSLEEILRNQPDEADFIRKCWETDCKDFEMVLPLLSGSQREWIHTMLTRYTPEIPWLKRF